MLFQSLKKKWWTCTMWKQVATTNVKCEGVGV
jgi:hypothetical protein